MKKLYWAVKKAKLSISRAAEIGVFSWKASTLKDFASDGIKCDLFEAVPEFCNQIQTEIAGLNNVTLHEHAVLNFSGNLELHFAGPSTFSSMQKLSPAINHDHFDISQSRRFTVPCVDFKAVDPGDFDLVTMDIEGSEYLVLERMVSRPMVISIETQSRDYVNPKLGAITDWMQDHGYKVWLRDDTDTIFIKHSRIDLGYLESLKARWHNLRYFAGRC